MVNCDVVIVGPAGPDVIALDRDAFARDELFRMVFARNHQGIQHARRRNSRARTGSEWRVMGRVE
jgi:hypothetical protein